MITFNKNLNAMKSNNNSIESNDNDHHLIRIGIRIECKYKLQINNVIQNQN